jgi:hypothetical protein
MARFEKYSLHVPQSATTGDPSMVQNLNPLTVQVEGTFVATLDIEGMVGGAWSKLTTGISAAALNTYQHVIEKLRVNVTAYTSGQPVVTVAGFDQRAQ